MWTKEQAKAFYDANPGLEEQWAAQARAGGALNYGNFAYQAYQASRGGQGGAPTNVPVELAGTVKSPSQMRTESMDAYNQANREAEAKLKQFDWYNDPLWKLRQSYGDNLQKGQVFTGPWEAGPAGRKDVYDLLMEKYGTVNLNDLIAQTGRPELKGATNYGKSTAALRNVRGWTPTAPGMLSGGPTSPSAPPVGTTPLPGGSTAPVGASGGSQGSFGGASSTAGSGMLNSQQNQQAWQRPTAPAIGAFRTVGDSSNWLAQPTAYTPQQLANGMLR